MLSACTSTSSQKAPNIILIMSDDMGFSDISPYGGEIHTPNLQFLADKGAKFSQFYNTARCCPSRASLLTGLYPQQAGIGHMVNDRGTPAYSGDLSFQAVTIAEVLKEAGYSTYLSGKWHVTPYEAEHPNKKNWPLQRGFDKFFGIIAGAGSFYDPKGLVKDNDYIPPHSNFYATTDFSKQAVTYIQGHKRENPFFLYLAYTAAHWPMHAPDSAIKKYKGKYDQGWDSIRASRYQRMKELTLIGKDWQLTNRDSLVSAWHDSIPNKDWEIANMETYAAMVDIMDQGIGEVIQALKEKGELDNTLILFLQDNGGCEETLRWLEPKAGDPPPSPIPTTAFQSETAPRITRDGKVVKFMEKGWPGPADGYTAYGPSWANVSNSPFREFKHWVHEGGISTPLIAYWPNGIEASGNFIKHPGHLIDIMATCVDVANADYPQSFHEHQIKPMEGRSLMKIIEKEEVKDRPIFWEHEGNRAVRKGKWKLVSKASRLNSFQWDKYETIPLEAWELYDMDRDRTEMQNVAAQKPELVEEMARMWIQWARKVGAVPRPN